MAVCPKVEYSSVPGAQVNKVIRKEQEVDWQNENDNKKQEKKKLKSSFFNSLFLFGQDK